MFCAAAAAAAGWLVTLFEEKTRANDVTRGCHNSFNSLVNFETTQAHMNTQRHKWILNKCVSCCWKVGVESIVWPSENIGNTCVYPLRSHIHIELITPPWITHTHTCTVIRDSIRLWLAVVILSSLTFESHTYKHTSCSGQWVTDLLITWQ